MLWKIIRNEKQYILSKFLSQLKVLNTHIFKSQRSGQALEEMLYVPLVHLPYSPTYLPPKVLHNLCFSFLLDITAVPKEIENSHAKCWGTLLRCLTEDAQVAYV